MIIERRGIFENGEQRFDCINCGSIFVAEKGEYQIVEKYKYINPDYVIECPVCGRKCRKNAT